MDAERWWPLFVNTIAIVWIALFVIDVAVGHGIVHLPGATKTGIRVVLQAALIIFLLDVLLLYRWSEKRPAKFVRANWFWILTVVPWFRPLRLLRIGRGLRAVRILVGTRRVGSFLNKAHRMGKRLWRRLSG